MFDSSAARNSLAPEKSAGGCTAHWERTGTFVPAYRLGLCRACFNGHPILPQETLGEYNRKPSIHSRLKSK